MYSYDGEGWLWAGAMLVLMVLVLGLIAWAVIRASSGDLSRRDRVNTPTARDILDARLARGEVSVEEYEERRRSLDREARVSGAGGVPVSTDRTPDAEGEGR